MVTKLLKGFGYAGKSLDETGINVSSSTLKSVSNTASNDVKFSTSTFIDANESGIPFHSLNLYPDLGTAVTEIGAPGNNHRTIGCRSPKYLASLVQHQ